MEIKLSRDRWQMVEAMIQRIERDLVAGSLTLHLLLQIDRAGPIHGYGLIKEMTALVGRPDAFKEGTIYPLLNELEHEGLVRSQWSQSAAGPARKTYAMTTAGRQVLRGALRVLDRIHESFTTLPNTARSGTQ